MEDLLKSVLGEFLKLFLEHPFFVVLLLFIAAIAILSRLPMFKGFVGELIMRIGFKLFLPKTTYRVINNVTIPDDKGGSTQIDHVIVSQYGIFIVETKHYKGWIFGGEHDRQWTQKIHGNHSQKFQNPLHQNYKHTECLRAMLGLEKEQVKSVVVFTGECTLKTPDKLPDHVTYPLSCLGYIKRKYDAIFDTETVAALETAIRENRLAPGWKTARDHAAHVRKLHAPSTEAAANQVESQPEPLTLAGTSVVCPKCGAEMVLRTAKRGKTAGDQFWGCSSYPRCREIMPVQAQGRAL